MNHDKSTVLLRHYLLRLVEREVHDREARAAQRRVKAARFPVVKTLDTFDFAAQPSINHALIRELARGEYIDRRENVLFIGNNGTGGHVFPADRLSALEHLPYGGTARAQYQAVSLQHTGS